MRFLSSILLKLMGWKLVGALPDEKKYIIIVAPHTSNWDMVIGLVARFSLGIKIRFLAKSQIFRFPFVSLLNFIGAIPVDRSKSGHLVEQITQLFKESPTMRLAITPEGTRRQVSRWKEGFYHMAFQANVPIVMIGFDYPSKEIRIAKPFKPSGDIVQDFAHILEFFRTIRGCYPKDLPDYMPRDS
ncbi:MAG: lysophospholipid acyltransferase family protein [Legionella sp.]|jgi:1-acyl-sn-glycerol-3-phosphate acyltransferase